MAVKFAVGSTPRGVSDCLKSVARPRVVVSKVGDDEESLEIGVGKQSYTK